MTSMRVTRRHALQGLLAGAMRPGLAFASIAARPGRRFALIILRGAMDGLAAVAPLADPDYAALRTSLVLGTPAAPGGALKLDSRFWLHPALAPVYPLYTCGELAIVHAVASPYRERSHFDAQNVIESGMVRPGWSGNGWLNRMLLAQHASDIQGIAFTPTLPLVLKGAAPVANWQPGPEKSDLHAAVTRLYQDDPVLSVAYAEGLAAGGLIDAASRGSPQKRDFASLATIAGQTLAAADGPNVAMLEIGGWDTHVGQGTARGRLATALAALAAGVAAMRVAMGPQWRETAVVAITEFGRTAHPNGTGGTDHGTATAGFVLGGAVAGGRVIADWPGLSGAALYQGRDLAPTADLRSLLKGVLGDHLGVTSADLEQRIFPDSAAARPLQGLIRA